MTPTGTRALVRVALFAAIIAVLGLIPRIDLPIAGGVPITAQTLGVMLAGVILGARLGAAAVLLFIAVVALGMPFLAGGRGGLGVFAGPTVGFLLGWIPGVVVTGLAFRALRGLPVAVAGALASVAGGIVAVYACGIVGLSLVTGMPIARAALASVVFFPGDLIKAALVGLLAASLPRSALEMNRTAGSHAASGGQVG
jgi:biotin transport system substrate-specific component